MKKIKILKKFDMLFSCLVAIFLLGAFFCLMKKESEMELFFYYLTFFSACAVFVLDIWLSYLIERLPEEEKERQRKEKANALYEQALDYVYNEKFGSISRFERRYGKDVYDRVVQEEYILIFPDKNKWIINSDSVFSV